MPLFLLLAIVVFGGTACSSPDTPPTIHDQAGTDAASGSSTQLPPSADGTLVGSPCPFAPPPGTRVACGTLTVPEDRSKANGRTIQLAVAVYESSSSAPQADPVVYLSGGPGSGALDELVAGAWRIFLPILEKRNLVVIDQRGTGHSVPKLSCTEFSSTSDALTSVDLTKLQACHDRLTGLGVDLSQYNTAANAADIRSLRTALGYASWNLLGISYGTRLAQEIMRQSTEGLRSIVLDSTLPPDVDLLAKSAADMARSLQHVFDTCDAKPYCDRTTPNFLERLDAGVDKLNASPLSVNVSGAMFSFSGDTLLGLVHALLYSPSTIPFVPMLVWELDQNDSSFVDALYQGVTAQPSTIADAMHLSVACREWVPRTSQAAFEEASAGVDPRVASALDPENTYIGVPVVGRAGRSRGGSGASGRRHADARSLGQLRSDHAARVGAARGERACACAVRPFSRRRARADDARLRWQVRRELHRCSWPHRRAIVPRARFARFVRRSSGGAHVAASFSS
jgi:pimeloyl-ACP methyl ester carboxylesterase